MTSLTIPFLNFMFYASILVTWLCPTVRHPIIRHSVLQDAILSQCPITDNQISFMVLLNKVSLPYVTDFIPLLLLLSLHLDPFLLSSLPILCTFPCQLFIPKIFICLLAFFLIVTVSLSLTTIIFSTTCTTPIILTSRLVLTQ